MKRVVAIPLEGQVIMDPVARVGLGIAVILIGAKIGGDLAMRLKQPSVPGELLAGILLGSLPLPFFETLRTDPSIDMLAALGAVILLFQVGLESTVAEVLRVGVTSIRVAACGAVVRLAWPPVPIATDHDGAGSAHDCRVDVLVGTEHYPPGRQASCHALGPHEDRTEANDGACRRYLRHPRCQRLPARAARARFLRG